MRVSACGLLLICCGLLTACGGGGKSLDTSGSEGSTSGVPPGGGTPGGTLPPPAAIGSVLFVTQLPVHAFQSVVETFGAHQANPAQAPRGGDLYIRYADGTLRNLTQEAGFGLGTQDSGNGIAVRQPVVHWSGARALFAMAVGSATRQFEVKSYRWQLYEVSGLAQGSTATITKLPCQPAAYNNIAPVYTSDDQIVFVSDGPRDRDPMHVYLYPQRDEYESQAIDTGLWKLDPVACSYKLLEHVVSGVTYPALDSFGRLIFTRWDHLQRDQQNDADLFDNKTYQNGSFNYDSELSNTVPAALSRVEYFPELRDPKYSSADGTSIAPDYPFSRHIFNQFFPWMLNQDGSGEETLNHVGRHELGGTYSTGNFRGDAQLKDTSLPGRFNGASYFIRGDGGIFHLREDPTTPGRYYGVISPEFSTATSGDLVYLDGAPGTNPDSMKLVEIGESDTYGRFRNPLMLSNGHLIAAHTDAKDLEGSADGNYAFRLREVLPGAGGALTLGSYLTAGINKCVDYWNPDSRVSFCGNLWELDPAEVRVRSAPAKTIEGPLPPPEQQVLTEQGINETLLRHWLQARSLALIVSRNVTTRDRADLQQPFNLNVTGSTTQTRGTTTGALYSISHLQLFQADQIRGYAGGKPPQSGGVVTPGRRPLALPMHDSNAVSAMGSFFSAPLTSVPLGADGSMAAFVPAGRAVTWQLIDNTRSGQAQGIVRERNWLSFKPGERRVCSSCHGVNTLDQAGNAAPQNPPLALGTLLTEWKKVVRNGCPASGGTGTWSYSGGSFSTCDEGEKYQIQTCQGGNGCCDGMPQTQTLTCP